jgi:hypothetical protein
VHTVPLAEQKAVAAPPPQHAAPVPPQFAHEPLVQVPALAPQVAPAATQVEPVQHPPAPQVEFAQQAWPVPPHEAKVPFTQTCPAAPFAPGGMQMLVASLHMPGPHAGPVVHAASKAPPQVSQVADVALHESAVALQVLPAQHGWPGPPQAAHWLVGRQRSPPAQVDPVEMHWFEFVLQQPVVQLLPAQHG